MNIEYQRIVSELNEKGIAKSHVDEIFDERYMLLYENVDRWLTEQEESERFKPFLKDRQPNRSQGKSFELNHYTYLGTGLTFDEDIVKMYTCPALIEIVDSYYGEWSRLRNIMSSIYIPNEMGRPRYASQDWHVDTEDTKILKVWIYFNDVDELNGAMEYKTATGEITSAVGSRGTIYFIDTANKHRGGYIIEGFRKATQGVYLRPSAPQMTGILKHFNYVSNKRPMWNIDLESDYFNNLDNRTKFLFESNE